jgi:TAT-translocated FGD2 family F420-dependent dehydrogenase
MRLEIQERWSGADGPVAGSSEFAVARGLSRRQLGRFGAAAVGGAIALGGAAACAPGAAPTPAPPTAPGAGKKVGFVLSHEQLPTAGLAELGEAAEQAGFGYLWASDHLQPWQENQAHASFPWITLGLVSQRTRQATFGTGVTCPTYRHHPSEVAQAFATLAGLAPGRVFLGVGTGEALNERAGTGQFGRYPERRDRLVEAIALIRQLWSGQRVSFQGRYFHTDQLKLYDLPSQPPPIYVAAGGPQSATLAGRYGDGWITTGGRIDADLRATFQQAAHDAGKDPAGMPVLVETFVTVGDGPDVDDAARKWRFLAAPGSAHLLQQPNPEIIQQVAQQAPLTSVTSGWVRGADPGPHIDAARRLLDAGAIPFIHAPENDAHRVIDFYGRKVLPELGSGH